jgi:hypothetical protein
VTVPVNIIIKVEVIVVLPDMMVVVVVLVVVVIEVRMVEKESVIVLVVEVEKVSVTTGTVWHSSGRVCPSLHGTVVVVKKVFPETKVIMGQFPAVCPPATHGSCKDEGKAPRLHQVYKFNKLDQLIELIEAGVAPRTLHTSSTVE